MRIISTKFHDYYDPVMRQGFDPNLVYVRNPKVVGMPRLVKPAPSGDNYRVTPGIKVSEYIVGFCGKLYGVLKLAPENVVWPENDTADRTAYAYSIGDVDAFVQKNFRKKQIDGYFYNKRYAGHRIWQTWNQSETHDSFKRWFDEVLEAKDKHEKLFLDWNVPIFVIGMDSRTNEEKKNDKKNWIAGKEDVAVTLNGCLKDLKFYRLFDAHTAYQEISMFLGGLASPDKKIPPVSNNDMIQAKGFNLKTSFRKEKDSG